MSAYRTLSAADFHDLRAQRAAHPEAVVEAYARRRKPKPPYDGRLFIVAADHPARGALRVGDQAYAMADRLDLLDRLAVALENPRVDGVLATADILDDLALLGLLDGKVVVGSMNRGGLAGASFEMDDRFTGYTVEGIVAAGLDFAKTLLRINLADPGTVRTLETTARVVDLAAEARLPIILEPFLSEWRDGRVVHDLTAEGVIRSIAVASGLGTSSAYTWLKIPVVPDMEAVAATTTLPVLLLGGDRPIDPEMTLGRWRSALALPGVRGLIAGRALLYPADVSVAAAVAAAADLVHPIP